MVREKADLSHSVQRLFAPQSIAVIGASPAKNKIGNVLVRNLSGFTGPIYPVHPTAKEVLGHPAFARVSDVGAPVDLALLAIPADAVASALADCATAGVGAAVIYSGDWAETGDAGRARQLEIAAIAQRHNIRLLGPNTSGFINPALGVYATFVADLPASVGAGKIAFVAQSGGVNLNLCFLAQSEGLGVRLGVGLGNAADTSWPDVLHWLADDAETSVVVLAIEGISDGRQVVHAIEKVAARKPVVAFNVGRNDVAAFAASHTGNLTGSYRVTRAALAQAGAIVVDSVIELVDAAHVLSRTRLAPKDHTGVAVVTAQAGPGLMLTDALRTRGLHLPPLDSGTRKKLAELLPPLTYQENPVDTGRPTQTFGDVVRTVRDAPGIDLLTVSLLHEPDAVSPADVLANASPAILCSQGPVDALLELRSRLAQKNVALFPTPERTAHAAAVLASDARMRYRRAARAAVPTALQASNFRPTRGWNEASAKELLKTMNIRSPERVICANRTEAHRALDKFAAPVAVKILRGDIAHKTELGGVHLNIRNADELDAALDAIDRAAGTPSEYLVERMIAPGPELLVGARRDPNFGPIVVLGAGGIGAEQEDDIAIRLAPADRTETGTMLGELRSAWRYRGLRGGLAVNEAALAQILSQAAALIAERSDIAELEINPLRITSTGLVALDALVVGT